MLLRIEDIDQTRSRPEFIDSIKEDLAWLGVHWDGEVRRQSEHMDDYAAALRRIEALDVTYSCFCTRKEIQAEIARSGEAPQGVDGPVYPGTCRNLAAPERLMRMQAGEPYVVRVDVAAAYILTGDLAWQEGAETIQVDHQAFGDFVVARKDTPTSYHLSVVVDDHLQGVSLVTRGRDLLPATQPQRLLQALIGFEPPRYLHHPLVVDQDGKRLAKRDSSTTIRSLRDAGKTPSEVLNLAARSIESD